MARLPKPHPRTFRHAVTQGFGDARGFTLLELLVAIAVFSMLVVLVVSMVGSVATMTTTSGKRMSADDEARMTFDRMAGDFTGMITRPEINPLWGNATGNDEFFFYSQAPGSFANATNSQISIVGYRMGTNGLERFGRGLGWDELYFKSGTPPVNAGDSSYFSTMAPSVFRIEYALVMKPGSTNNDGKTNVVPNIYSKTNNPGQAMLDVAGIVVALGVLDSASRKILPDGTMTNSQIINQFPDSTPSGIPTGDWITNAGTLSIPPAARGQIRIYQRYFSLNR